MNFKLKLVPPFDFELSARIFSTGDDQIRKFQDGKYGQVIRVDNKLILVIIKSLGTVDEPELSVELKSNEELKDLDIKRTRDIIQSLFNLNMNLNSFYDDVKEDHVMSRLTRELRGLKSPTTPTIYEALIESIIEQQISLNVAHSLEKKVIKSFGDALKLEGKIYYAFPAPEKMASATIPQIRECGLSQRKAEYISEISKLVANKELDLDKFKKYQDINEIITDLDRVRGIGVWTAELTIIRSMQKFDSIPADDLGVRRVISHYYCNDRKIPGEEARKIAEKWGRWKGLASFYLIVADMMSLEF